MTNAEAIEHLKNIIIFSYQDGYTAETREALDMAIKALKAQEWVPVSKRLPKDERVDMTYYLRAKERKI